MDNYSQRNCMRHGLVLLKVSGRRLLKKGFGDKYWKELRTYANEMICYKEALRLTAMNAKYVKL